MRRREFLAASCLAGAAPLARLAQAAGAGDATNKQCLELRLYRVGSEDQRKRLDEFLGGVAVPAWNRIGIAPVGAFQMQDGKSQDLYVLLPHASAESAITATARVLADAKFLQDGKQYLELPKKDPLFGRIESWLLLAFDGVPKVEVPTKKDTRVFQLRIYESHSVLKGQKKIEMFNAGGELAVFRKTGMTPVFFGEAIIGSQLPNLTYMLGFDDMEANKAAWARFLAHPEWQKLKGDAAYKDTVSNITNLLLLPTAYSQV